MIHTSNKEERKREVPMLTRAIAMTIGIAFSVTPVLAQTAQRQHHPMAHDSAAASMQMGQETRADCPYWQMMGTPGAMMGMMGGGMMGSGMMGMPGQGSAGHRMMGGGTMGSGMMGMGNGRSQGQAMMGGMGGQGSGMMSGMMSMGLPGPRQLIAMSEDLHLSAEQVSDLEDVRDRATQNAEQEMDLALVARDRAAAALEQNPDGFTAYAEALREASSHITEANVAIARGAFEARALLTPKQTETLTEVLSQWGYPHAGGMMGGMMDPSHHAGG
jgi:hypothetical protein